MKRALAALVCSACVVGPNLVTAPMLSSLPVASAPVDASDDDDADAEIDDTPPVRLDGSWTGRAWQTGNATFPLTVTFESRGADVLGRVHYPDQHCRAEWRLRRAEGRQWAGEETVLVDPFNRCPRHGHVVVTPLDEGAIRWNWTAPGRAASANLERDTQP